MKENQKKKNPTKDLRALLLDYRDLSRAVDKPDHVPVADREGGAKLFAVHAVASPLADVVLPAVGGDRLVRRAEGVTVASRAHFHGLHSFPLSDACRDAASS